jgi:hypothetical protein
MTRSPGDRRLRAHPDRRRLALRPLVLRRREGADRAAEARLRALHQQGPLRLLPRHRADPGPLHRQPLPQRRRRHQRIQDDVPALAQEFLEAKATLAEVDVEVLTDPRTSELGRFAITTGLRRPRRVQDPDPAQHRRDRSLHARRQPRDAARRGGALQQRRRDQRGRPVNDFLSGGIRPLNLTDEEIDDLVAFMEALTSPQFAALPSGAPGGEDDPMSNDRSPPRFPEDRRRPGRRSRCPSALVELAFADRRRTSPSPTSPTPTSSTSRAPVRPQLGPRADPRGRRDEPAHPKPDFVMFGGDLAQLGTKAELDHGAEMLSPSSTTRPTTSWASTTTTSTWASTGRSSSGPVLQLRPQGRPLRRPQQHPHLRRVDLQPLADPEQRMLEMAGLDNPNGSPFMVGEAARVAEGPRKVKGHPGRRLLALAHPEDLQGLELLDRGRRGGPGPARAVRQGQRHLRPRAPDPVQPDRQHRFNAVMATAWPWPYPQSYAQAEQPPAGPDRADEPRRSLLRARRHRLAVHRRRTPGASPWSTTSTTTPTAWSPSTR